MLDVARRKPTGAEIVRLQDVSKVYQMSEEVQVKALVNVVMSVYEGELVCILGPSGSGKSTLLHILGMLDTPTAGKRYLDGVDTSRLSEKELAKARGKKIGFVFQTFNLIPSLTALENVTLPLIVCDMISDEKKEEAKQLLISLGLGHRLYHYPNQLSGGERQRVSIARSIVNNPQVILADEPTGNLDSKAGGDVLRILKELHKKGKTVVIITHDQSIAKLATRVLRLKDGMILE